jgi:N-methylhydantoinase A
MSQYICGIDTGGTFTDTVVIERASGHVVTNKALSTPDDFARGLFESLDGAARLIDLDGEQLLRRTEQVIVGTTVGTNAFLERKGAVTAMLVTRGFRDTLHIMRGVGRVAGLSPEDAMMLEHSDKPAPLVPKTLIREVDERIDADGDVLLVPDRDAVLAATQELVDAGAQALSICLLWAFKEPGHERLVRDWVREAHPDLYLSCSHEVAPKIGEYERFAATAINAYVGPVTRRYIETVSDSVRERGYGGRLLVMGCNGGVRGAKAAAEEAIVTLNSGPAGGVTGTAALGRHIGRPHAITADVGGTSFDVGLIHGGVIESGDMTVLGQYEFFIPAIDVRSIGAGGGSVAWLDEQRRTLRVGPQSAGSDPGPVCYGRGGTLPTLTDAALVLGYLSEQSFLGRGGRLDVEAAREALGDLGRELGLEADDVAAGVVRIAEARMADLIRSSVVSRGHDPRDFSIFAFGGAGPLHAAGFARDLNVSSVIVPAGNSASVWSAYGVGTSDIRHVHEYASLFPEPFDLDAINAVCADLVAKADRRLDEEQVDRSATTLLFEGGLRYRSQLHEVYVQLQGAPAITQADMDQTVAAFEDAYGRVFGEEAGFRHAGVELVDFRLTSVTSVDRPSLPEVSGAIADDGERRTRRVRFVGGRHDAERVEALVLDGERFAAGREVRGPVIVELPGTSIAVAPDYTVTRDATGSFVLTRHAD